MENSEQSITINEQIPQRPSIGTRSAWDKLFGEPDGTPGVGLLLSALAMVFCLGWSTAIIATHLHRHFEPVLPDFTSMAAFVSAPLVIHRMGNFFDNRISNGNNGNH